MPGSKVRTSHSPTNIFSLLTIVVLDVLIVDTEKDLNVCKDHFVEDESASSCAKPRSRPEEQNGYLNGSTEAAAPSAEIDYNEYAGSFRIYAVKA